MRERFAPAISVCAHRPRILMQELVRTMGVEPIPPFGERILSPLRLPFRHVRYWPEKPQNYACSGNSIPENDI